MLKIKNYSNALWLFVALCIVLAYSLSVFADMQNNTEIKNGVGPVTVSAGLFCRNITNSASASAYVPIDYLPSWYAFVGNNSPPSGLSFSDCVLERCDNNVDDNSNGYQCNCNNGTTTVYYVNNVVVREFAYPYQCYVNEQQNNWNIGTLTFDSYANALAYQSECSISGGIVLAGTCHSTYWGDPAGLMYHPFGWSSTICLSAGTITNGSGVTINSCNDFGNTGDTVPCTSQYWYLDNDSDGYYPDSGIQIACSNPGTGWTSTMPINGSGDCNDRNASVNPGIAGTCYYSTWYLDADNDGYYPTNGNRSTFESPGTGWSNLTTKTAGDCNDANNNTYTGALEIKDCQDNNCNGQIDEGLTEASCMTSDGVSIASCQSLSVCTSQTSCKGDAGGDWNGGHSYVRCIDGVFSDSYSYYYASGTKDGACQPFSC